ncbi:uncharacterized protein LOC107363979 [Tetranychus urticae]|uniref:Uncharacterized protein n=1 Tax=Tetranychus urticae TaxID=32264 RepID=T1KH31_TETUR|nr:uncharacterized protein LOC107363979 [Tetranychus urticae]
MLYHCTLIVRSGSLTRSVSPEPTSPNVNETDKFVTLVDSKAKPIKVSQLIEARLLRSSKREVSFWKVMEHLRDGVTTLLNVPLMFALSLLRSGQIVDDVLKKNPLKLEAIDYFLLRLGKYLKNRNANNP